LKATTMVDLDRRRQARTPARAAVRVRSSTTVTPFYRGSLKKSKQAAQLKQRQSAPKRSHSARRNASTRM
jgi:hypothetical protein